MTVRNLKTIVSRSAPTVISHNVIKTTLHLYDLLPPNPVTLVMREAQANPKRGTFYEIPDQHFSKLSSKKNLRKCHSQEEPKETRQLNVKWGTFLVLEWLRLIAPNAGGPGSIPGQRTRSHTTHLKIPKTWHSQIIHF